MIKFLKEWWGCFLFFGLLIGTPIACAIQSHEKELICLSQESKIEEYILVSLFDYENISNKSSLNGGFFLMMGAISGQKTSDLKYYIRYAYEDKYGIKLMTEEISNTSKIRIKEVQNKQPKLIIKYEKQFNYIPDICTDTELVRIFEIPEGTIYKTFEINMK